VGSHQGYIYIRGEYALRPGHYWTKRSAESLQGRFFWARTFSAAGIRFDMVTHTGAGALRMRRRIGADGIPRRQSADNPRIRPPFPPSSALYGSPTVINNVETLSATPEILRRGRRMVRGPRVPPKTVARGCFCISGHVEQARHLRIADGLPAAPDD